MKKIFVLVFVIMYCFMGIGFCADKVIVIPLFSEKCIPCNGTLNGTRWCDNGDGTITDLIGYNGKGQGLVWLKNASWGGTKPWRVNAVDGYDDAHTRASILEAGTSGAGLSDGSVKGDWRLPTKEELVGLTHGTAHVYCHCKPGYISGCFCNIYGFINVLLLYWTNTTDATNWAQAHTIQIHIGVGAGNVVNKTAEINIWPVRSPH